MPSPTTQNLVARISGLELALQMTLRELAVKCGENARTTIESLRDEAINRFNTSDLDAEREMEHADVVRPAIEVIDIAFNAALRNL